MLFSVLTIVSSTHLLTLSHISDEISAGPPLRVSVGQARNQFHHYSHFLELNSLEDL